jgi:ornithine cyclodeaminase/alanine dehydrogenase
MGALGTIVVDDLAQERANPKPVVDFARVAGDVAGLIGGACRAAFDPAAPSAFVFRGMAIGDWAIACLALDRALAAGSGKAAHW